MVHGGVVQRMVQLGLVQGMQWREGQVMHVGLVQRMVHIGVVQGMVQLGLVQGMQWGGVQMVHGGLVQRMLWGMV